jgi:hypothetical protein
MVLSSLKGEGMDQWCDWLIEKVKEKKETKVKLLCRSSGFTVADLLNLPV